MKTRMTRRSTTGWPILAVPLVLAAVLGCGKRSEPAAPVPGPNEPNAPSPAPVEPNAQAEIGRDFRILYAGHPGSERETDFVQFLREYFGTVETTDLATFVEAQCEGFDVTILDYDGEGFEAPRPMISRQFSRPLVTVGVPGGLMCSQWQLKTGYL